MCFGKVGLYLYRPGVAGDSLLRAPQRYVNRSEQIRSYRFMRKPLCQYFTLRQAILELSLLVQRR